ncbi:hypothetical protein SB861_37805 [Paraburkholderia sp. SIMBA_049]
MSDIRFQYRYKPFSDPQVIDEDYILYYDESGQMWTVPLNVGQWMDRDIYQPWLAAGGVPEQPS